MKRALFILIIATIPYTTSFSAAIKTEKQLDALYNSLSPSSISQHLAFYTLYGDTLQGRKAYDDAMHLLGCYEINDMPTLPLPNNAVNTMVSFVALPNNGSDTPHFSEEECAAIQLLASTLGNRHLPGSSALTEKEVLLLDDCDVDIARALLLSSYGSDMNMLMQYETLLDLMALEVRSNIPRDATTAEAIDALSTFIFDTMRFRFPPSSVYHKDIDYYTFLPSVLDSRRGVCLGVSTLYLCLAQRLGISLEAVTPPGHIFLRHKKNDGTYINIETTARGIDIDSDHYLGINTKELPVRSQKEVVGLVHFNQASVWWQKSDYNKALESYLKARPYLAEDSINSEFLAYALIATGDRRGGEKILKSISSITPSHLIRRDSMAADYIEKNIDIGGIALLFTSTDETRDSLITKKNLFSQTLKKHPKFRAGHLALATTLIQLNNTKDALSELLLYHMLDDTDPTVEYYLSVLYLERLDYNNAHKYLANALAITKTQHHIPEALTSLKTTLSLLSPP